MRNIVSKIKKVWESLHFCKSWQFNRKQRDYIFVSEFNLLWYHRVCSLWTTIVYTWESENGKGEWHCYENSFGLVGPSKGPEIPGLHFGNRWYKYFCMYFPLVFLVDEFKCGMNSNTIFLILFLISCPLPYTIISQPLLLKDTFSFKSLTRMK